MKTGKLNALYLLYGEDTFLLENCLKKIKTNFGTLVDGINYIKIDETNIDQLIPNIETPCFGKKINYCKKYRYNEKGNKKERW